MAAAISAGVIYALLVFLIGTIFGTVRVLLLIPHLGEIIAVSLEAPIMLAASWFVCRWCVDRLNMRRGIGARTVMGLVGFAVLMLAELGLSVLMFGRSAAEFAVSYVSVAGAVGLAAQIVSAIFPVVQVRRR
jgi:hypothetical protein